MRWTEALELMATITAREQRAAEDSGEHTTGLMSLHQKIKRSLTGRR